MYEDYLTKSLSSIIIAKQALNNDKVTIVSIMSALEETEKWLITIKPAYKAKLADVNKKLNL